MYQEVFQKCESRSIVTAFVYGKCKIVSHGLGIAFWDTFMKWQKFEVSYIFMSSWERGMHHENRICQGKHEGTEYQK